MEDGTEIENDEMVTRQSRLMVEWWKSERIKELKSERIFKHKIRYE